MSIGYRVFLVEGDSVSRVSRKAFDRLRLRDEPVFPEFAGECKTFATVVYAVQSRRPERIIRIDCERIRFGPRGEIANEHRQRSDALNMEGLEQAIQNRYGKTSFDKNVIDATRRFHQKAWEHVYPEVPGPVLKQILDILFPR